MKIEEEKHMRRMNDDNVDVIERRMLTQKAEREIAKEQMLKKTNIGFKKESWKGSPEEIWQSRQNKEVEEDTSEALKEVALGAAQEKNEITRAMIQNQSIVFSIGNSNEQQHKTTKSRSWHKQKGCPSLGVDRPATQLTPHKRTLELEVGEITITLWK
ncbi:unnamed protein product [Linum trigynum]|uniref:Uncharacterized protein n=1 Tax=Linum trigynum TaxID=586398 RepID=A0AAV2GDF9_9ROSI